MSDVDRAKLKTNLNGERSLLVSQRTKVESEWRLLYDMIFPYRGKFDTDKQNEKRRPKLFDRTATRAVKMLAAGMQSGLTSPSQRWFKLSPADPDMENYKPVREWLDDVEDRCYTVLGESNYYECTHASYEEIGIIGTSCITMYPDFNDVFRCHTLTGGEYYLGISGVGGKIDTFYEDCQFTAGRLAREFGKDKLSVNTRNLLDTAPNTFVNVRHCIRPNDDYIPGTIGPQGFAYLSAWWEDGGKSEEFLKLSGFDAFPVFTPRWEFCGSDIYGYGPGHDAIADVNTANLTRRDALNASKLAYNPPLMADSSLRDKTIDLGPGKVTYVKLDGMTAYNPIRSLVDTKPDYNGTLAMLSDARQIINQCYFVDLFQMVASATDRDKTAREVAELHEEKLSVLGPLMMMQNKELNSPSIELAISYLKKANLLPPMPQEFATLDVKIDYISIFAQAQKMAGKEPIEQFISFTGNVAGAYPTVGDNIDIDQGIRIYADKLAVPQKMLRSEDEVQQLRAEREKAAQQQQALAQMEQLGKGVQNMASGAELMSKTPVSGNDSLLEAMGGGA